MRALGRDAFINEELLRARRSLREHELVREVIGHNSWWQIQRPRHPSSAWVVSTLPFETVLVHGSGEPCLFGGVHERDPISALAECHTTYLMTRAELGMRRPMHCLEESVLLFDIEEQIREAEKEENPAVAWREAKAALKDGDPPHDVVGYLYQVLQEVDVCGFGRAPETRLIWAHAVLQRLYELLKDKT